MGATAGTFPQVAVLGEETDQSVIAEMVERPQDLFEMSPRSKRSQTG